MLRRRRTTAGLPVLAALLFLPIAARAQRPTATIWLSPGNQNGVLLVEVDGHEFGRVAAAVTVFGEREPKEKMATSRTAADAGGAPAVDAADPHLLVSFHLGVNPSTPAQWAAEAKRDPAAAARTVTLVEQDAQKHVVRTYTFSKAYPRSVVLGTVGYKHGTPSRMDLVFEEFTQQ